MVFMSYYLTASVLYEHHGIVTRMDLGFRPVHQDHVCLLYTSDAADE